MPTELFPDPNLEKQKKRCGKVVKELEKLYPNPKLALNFSKPHELMIALILVDSILKG